MVLLKDKIKQRIEDECMIVDPSILSEDDQKFFQKEYEVQNGRERLSSSRSSTENLKNLSDQISFASYNIRIGKKIMIEGSDEYELTNYSKVILQPFEVAIIQTYEIVNIPKNIIARWNIKVSSAYDGLIWVGGPQVDPGYCGYLYCPVYNMSDKEIVLEFEKDIATMDFVTTTESTDGSSMFNKKIKPFDYYKNKHLKSALTTHVQDKIKEMDAFKDKMEERLHKLQTTFLTVVGALFATLSIIILTLVNNKNNIKLCDKSIYFAIALSTFSILMQKTDLAPWYNYTIKIFAYISIIILFIYMMFKV